MIHPRIMRFKSGDLSITNTILYFDQQLSSLSCTEIICCFPFFGSLACSLVIRPLQQSHNTLIYSRPSEFRSVVPVL